MENEKIFIYGTLKSMLVQLTLFGRSLEMREGILHNYEVYSGGDGSYLVFPKEGAKVVGYIAELSEQEMQIADSWEEISNFERKLLPVNCNEKEIVAWAYIGKYDEAVQGKAIRSSCYNFEQEPIAIK